MTCEHCCDSEKIFNEKEAKKRLRKYLKKGPRKTSHALLKTLKTELNGYKSVLDIGAGIGAVHLDLLENGLDRATHVDASLSYLRISEELAEKKGLKENVTYHYGDFMDEAPVIDQHDVVVLDKVVCCYPFMKDLLNSALSKSDHLVGLTFPMNNLIGKSIFLTGNLFLWLKGSSFRAYLHSIRDIRKVISDNGFVLARRTKAFPWMVEVYKRAE